MARIEGTEGPDTIVGTARGDRIFPLGGDDVVDAAAGTDRIEASEGDDRLRGGTGEDYLFGGPGDDELRAGVDRNFENLFGGDGDDLLWGEGLAGGAGAFLVGDAGRDQAWGGEDDEGLQGGSQADKLWGNGGADEVGGGQGADRLYGGAGNDLLEGNQGDDVVTGDGPGAGAGADRFDFLDGAGLPGGRDLFTDFGRGADRFYLGGDAVYGFEDLDTNGSGVLDDGDEHVAVRSVTFGDRTADSTVIDVSSLQGEAPGTATVTFLGVTHLSAGDFLA